MPTPATDEALRLLIAERDRIDQAIRLLGGGEAQQPRRRGRPPKTIAQKAGQATKKRRGRPPMTDAEKKAASERMKKYWAAKKAMQARR